MDYATYAGACVPRRLDFLLQRAELLILISLRRINSSIEITEVTVVAFSSPFTELPKAGKMIRATCGSSTRRRDPWPGQVRLQRRTGKRTPQAASRWLNSSAATVCGRHAPSVTRRTSIGPGSPAGNAMSKLWQPDPSPARRKSAR